MKRTVDQMDEKDWIILRLATLIGNALGMTAALSFNDYYRACLWLEQNIPIYSIDLDPIRAEQGFTTVADWPYVVPDDPLPAECQLITSEI